jgi:hypothetical protein
LNKVILKLNKKDRTFRVSVGNKVTDASPFDIGSTEDDVVNAMGTPNKITDWGALWHYKDSTVEFDNSKVDFYNNDSNNLKTPSSNSSINSGSSETDNPSTDNTIDITYVTSESYPGGTSSLTAKILYRSGL